MIVRTLAVAAVLLADTCLTATEPPRGNLRTRNFIVTAPDQQLATQIGFAAEKYRRELAIEWLGQELPDWPEPCMVTAYIKPEAFGETSFSFAGRPGEPSQPFDFVMQVNGSRERILDSVLPHEVSHTIFATHFKQPLPRWADEGACTTVEHISERRKNHQMLIEFLTTGRGIPFNRMFAMKNYPRDILPLYAQGYSLCRFLIQRGGKRKFIRFMEEGMQASNWDAAVGQHYGISNLSELQLEWLKWVKAGCPQPDDSLIVRSNEADQPANQPANQPVERLLAAADADDTRPSAAPPRQTPVESTTGASARGRSSQAQPSREQGGDNENFYLREIRRVKAGTMLR